jgi:tRNA-specific 2-thiouridylase
MALAQRISTGRPPWLEVAAWAFPGVVDLRAELKQRVLDYFAESYCRGRTPNPCMVCNRTIKFGRLLEIATEKGLSFLATGHYARIIETPAGPCRLLTGRDPAKDQSYFLSRLTQAQLARVRLPLGEYTKKKVYGIAQELGLAGLPLQKSDVCFLRDRDVVTFWPGHAAAFPTWQIGNVEGDSLGRRKGSAIYHWPVLRASAMPPLIMWWR